MPCLDSNTFSYLRLSSLEHIQTFVFLLFVLVAVCDTFSYSRHFEFGIYSDICFLAICANGRLHLFKFASFEFRTHIWIIFLEFSICSNNCASGILWHLFSFAFAPTPGNYWFLVIFLVYFLVVFLVVLHNIHLNFLKRQTNRMCARFFSVSFWVQAVYFIRKASPLAGERKETQKKYASNFVTLGGGCPRNEETVAGAPTPSHVIWAGPPKMMVGRKSVSTTWGKCGARMTSHVFWAKPPVKKLGEVNMIPWPNFFTGWS